MANHSVSLKMLTGGLSSAILSLRPIAAALSLEGVLMYLPEVLGRLPVAIIDIALYYTLG